MASESTMMSLLNIEGATVVVIVTYVVTSEAKRPPSQLVVVGAVCEVVVGGVATAEVATAKVAISEVVACVSCTKNPLIQFKNALEVVAVVAVVVVGVAIAVDADASPVTVVYPDVVKLPLAELVDGDDTDPCNASLIPSMYCSGTEEMSQMDTPPNDASFLMVDNTFCTDDKSTYPDPADDGDPAIPKYNLIFFPLA